jgi:hypothetical protein
MILILLAAALFRGTLKAANSVPIIGGHWRKYINEREWNYAKRCFHKNDNFYGYDFEYFTISL